MAKATKRKRNPEKRGKRNALVHQVADARLGKAHAPAHVSRASLPPEPSPGSDATILDRLWTVVVRRRTADPAVSHSARLLGRGMGKVAQKFGEEAVECLIEGVRGDHRALISESADVLYHLLVLWVAADVKPAEVWAELVRREGISGIAEKASRKAPGFTRKIP